MILAVALLLGGVAGPVLGQGAPGAGEGAPATVPAPAGGAVGSSAISATPSPPVPAVHGTGEPAASAGQPPASASSTSGSPAASAAGVQATTAAVPPIATPVVQPAPSPVPASAAPAPAAATPPLPAAIAAPPVPPLPAPPSTTRLQLSSVLGRTLTDPAGESVGRIVDVLVDVSGQPKAAVIDFGGFMGLGSRRIAVTWDSISFPLTTPSAQVRLSLTPDQIRSTPEYTGIGQVVTVVGPPSQAPTPGP